MNKKYLISCTMVIAIFVGGFYLFNTNHNSITYLTETVKRGDLKKSVIATGTLTAYQRVEVGAQVSGKIEKIHVKLGQLIQQGDLIAEIDSQTQRNHLNTAQAKLTSYRSQLNAKTVAYDIAKSSYERSKKLYGQKAISLTELDDAKNTFAIAQAAIQEITATIKQAEIEVNTAKTNLGYTKILSPITGTVISIPVAEGQTVNANQTTPTIIQVADLSKMQIRPEISEGDITKVKVGMPIIFSTLSDPQKQYVTVINTIDPALTTLTDNEYSESITNTKAVYFYANALVDNPDNKLRIGMTAQTEILVTEVKNVLLIPTTTLKPEGNKVFVQLLKDNQVEKREVIIGLNDELNTEILSGLHEGEKVISSQIDNTEKVNNTTRRPRIF
ncbi:efflux RND transporter periplasmic adaptor subunit [Pasteurella canis]|uniref:Macrolide-specific efflux protein MacA n=1 Tax=Pasteurella canis TaxID=753 RepID=A0A379EUA0_9PAST|nr:efflux RND transporter periplasmic adaptor subunit [Pasteurella canis]MXN87612.1 efflux RND transporter periplasmic adaptor subunit [Pasteurella canis]UAY78258.1 efflux RND transporter periplasmic adaptor subunit [Pasteurella canis]SUC09951.1 macrolide-specific efflux protein MacA [Pasteurella canis]